MTVEEASESCQQWWMKEALERLVERLNSSDIDKEAVLSSSLS